MLEGFFAGVGNALKVAKIGPRDVDGFVVHATTIVTNALIERKGPPTALLVTEGFRDVLHIRNEHRYEMYDPQIEFPDPLVSSELTFGVPSVSAPMVPSCAHPIVKQVIEALASQLKARGVALGRDLFLNSYANPGTNYRGKRIAAACPNYSSLCHRMWRHKSANIRALQPPPSTPIRCRFRSPICAAKRAAREGRLSQLASDHVVVGRRGRR